MQLRAPSVGVTLKVAGVPAPRNPPAAQVGGELSRLISRLVTLQRMYVEDRSELLDRGMG